jgi:hypothetical protein
MELAGGAESVEPDWQDALARAGYVGRHFPRRREALRPRRVLVLVAVMLTVIYTVSAFAADNPRGGVVYWLLDRSGETYPVKQTPTLGEWVYRERATFDSVQTSKGWVPEVRAVPVIQGAVARQRFEMQAFLKEGDLRVGFSAGGPAEHYYGTNVPSLGSVGSDFAVHGLRPVGEEDLHWVSMTLHVPGPINEGGGTGPKWLFGVTNPNVSRVDLENDNDGTVVSVPTFAAPKDLAGRVRLWVAALRLDQLVHTVVPRDKDGEALEHWHQRIAQ